MLNIKDTENTIKNPKPPESASFTNHSMGEGDLEDAGEQGWGSWTNLDESFCLGALFAEDGLGDLGWSYRRDREIESLREAQLDFDKKWATTISYNFPFKPINGKITIEKSKSNQKEMKLLKTLQWNCNGLIGKEKIDKLESLLLLENPDVISLVETKTNSTTESYIYELSRRGYFPMIKNRMPIVQTNNGKIISTDTSGGGGRSLNT